MICDPILDDLLEDGAQAGRTLLQLFDEYQASLLQILVMNCLPRLALTAALRLVVDHLVDNIFQLLDQLREV